MKLTAEQKAAILCAIAKWASQDAVGITLHQINLLVAVVSEALED